MHGQSSHFLFLVQYHATSHAIHKQPIWQDVYLEYFYLPKLNTYFLTFLRHLKISRILGQRTADVTGVSRSKVDWVRKEKKETGTFLSPKKIVERGPYKYIGGFNQAAIRLHCNIISPNFTPRRSSSLL